MGSYPGAGNSPGAAEGVSSDCEVVSPIKGATERTLGVFLCHSGSLGYWPLLLGAEHCGALLSA